MNKQSSEGKKYSIFTEVSVGMSFKSKGWTLPKHDFKELIPTSKYEGKCHIEIDKIIVPAKIRMIIRLFYYSNDVSKHLENLYLNPKTKIPIELKTDPQYLYSNIISKFKDAKKLKYINIELPLSKSHLTQSWRLPKKMESMIIPLDEYPDRYDVLIDGIETKGRIDIGLGLSFNDDKLSNHLETLYNEDSGRNIIIKIILDDELIYYDCYNQIDEDTIIKNEKGIRKRNPVYGRVEKKAEQKNNKKTKEKRFENAKLDELLINEAIKYLKNGTPLNILHLKLNITKSKLTEWFELGEGGFEPYKKFYDEVTIQLNQPTKKNKFKPSDLDKSKEKDKTLSNRLIRLTVKELDFILEDNNLKAKVNNKHVKIRTIKQNLSSDEIKNSLEKVEEKKDKEILIKEKLEKLSKKTLLNFLDDEETVKEYENKEKSDIIKKIIKELKYSEIDEFYELTLKLPIEYYNDSESKNKKEIDKDKDKKFSNRKSKEYKTSHSEKETKKCIICGAKIRKNSSKDKCIKCSRKIHAANLLNELSLSIKPEIPFYKEDLIQLNYSSIKIQDLIWTLQEQNLLNVHKNDKYSLKDQNTINKFLEEWKDYLKIPTQKNQKLYKKCIICENELAISKFKKSSKTPDGFTEYCKDCSKFIDAAIGLNYILNYVKAKEEFALNDLYQYYPQSFILENDIFLLQENNLIEFNLDKNTYSLKGQNILDKFLEKYLIEDEIRPKFKKSEENKPRNLDKYFSNETGQNKEKKETSKTIANEKEKEETVKISNKKEKEKEEQHPKEKKGKEEDKAKKETKKVQKEEDIDIKTFDKYDNTPYAYNYTQRKHKIIIEAIKLGKTCDEAAKLADLKKDKIKKWYHRGELGIIPFKEFYDDYKIAKSYIEKKRKEKEEEEEKEKEKYLKEFKLNQYKANNFLELIKEGHTDEESINISKIKKDYLNKWMEYGKENIEPFDEFFRNYLNAKAYANLELEEFIMNEDTRKDFIKLIKNKDDSEALKITKLNKKLLDKWNKKGKENIAPYNEFYEDYQKVKTKSEENRKITNIQLKILNESKNTIDLLIEGKINNDNLDLVNKILKSFKIELGKISINRTNVNELELFLELTIEKDKLDYFNSLINIY